MISRLCENYQIVYKSWYTPEIEGMTLMLNMPHVLVTGHKEIEPELNWEFLPYWLVFGVLEDSTQALGGEHVSVLSCCKSRLL